MKMSKNIEWKKSEIDFDKLNELSHNQLMRIENGKNAVLSGQLKSICVLGGKSSIAKMNKKNQENGHFRKLGDAKKGVPRDEETKKKIKESTFNSWKPILQFTKDGEFVREWKNFISIKEELGFNHTNICAVCKNKPKCKTAYGFIWKYKEEN